MAISGASPTDYRAYLARGGKIVFKLDGEDIAHNFEPPEGDRFELPPTSAILGPKTAAGILVFGDDWAKIVVVTYRRDGSIIYSRNPNGGYFAECTSPAV